MENQKEADPVYFIFITLKVFAFVTWSSFLCLAELTDLEVNGLVIIMIEYELIDSQDGRGDHCQSK